MKVVEEPILAEGMNRKAGNGWQKKMETGRRGGAGIRGGLAAEEKKEGRERKEEWRGE